MLAALALASAAACSAPADDNPPSNGTGGAGPMGGAGGDMNQAGSGGTPMTDGGTGGTGGTPEGGGTGGASDGGATLLDNPLSDPPQNLADVGIFTTMPDITKTDARAFYYEPKHPLWSNGLSKHRYMVLPEGKKIDTSVGDAWAFPVGTLFFKTFSYTNAQGKITPIETRMIRHFSDTGAIEEQWEFFVYEWNAEATGAALANITLRTPRQALVDGKTITHNIPKLADCWNCHIANKTPIIGFDELRLNSKLAGQAELQLDQVIAKGWLTAAPAKPYVAITDPDPTQEQAFQYLQGNCVHCHNGEMEPREPGARFPQLDLRPQNVIAQTRNIDTYVTGTGSGKRIIPGDPSHSVLFEAVSRTGDPEVKPMPLVGVDVVDTKAVTILEQWITALK